MTRIVVQNDGNFVRFGDHMVVGHDEAGFVDDESRSQRRGPAWRTFALVAVKKLLEKILERRARWGLRDFLPLGGAHHLRAGYIDHGGQ